MSSVSWRFGRAFWTANSIELCERAAYYGWFIMLASFLTDVVHYTDIQAGFIVAVFAGTLYFLPFLSGALADRIGYRRALLLALTLLAIGYASLSAWPVKHWVLLALGFIVLGGALFKPVILGTVARSSSANDRARAFSLFYMVVNIGSIVGQTAARPVRVHAGLALVPRCSAGIILLALVAVALFYFPTDLRSEENPTPSLRGAWLRLTHDLRDVLSSGRLMAIVLITAGFWLIQTQLYSSMPKYVLRMIGNDASPEWYAMLNPIMVTLLVVPITQLTRKLPAITSIALAMTLIPLSSLLMAALPRVLGDVALPGPLRVGPLSGAAGVLNPVTVAVALGIASNGLSECFLSPRYLEYASSQAPSGKEGLYMGYSNMNNFFAYVFGSILSGFLLNSFCPDPARLSPPVRAAYAAALRGEGPMPAVYAHAHYLWYVFAGLGSCALVCLLVFQRWAARSRPEQPLAAGQDAA
jgi:dipeptide/tripeptide permease